MRRWMLASALTAVLALSACTPEPEPGATPSASPSATVSASAAPTAPAISLPDCDSIYSPALVAALEAEGRTSEGDVSALGGGGWGTFDVGVEAILSAIPEAVHCTWILPASESGSTTSIAMLDDASRTALVAAFAGGGFVASTAPGGDLYSITVEEEFITYTESHLLTAEVWIASAYAFGDASTLTLDAAAQLLS
ncbi:MAG: hypothetical protein KIT89_01410 [Microcella sp.]|uniref:hypothetical protein n=1 Tax=Microcella sp. TaxID=1913979 RepID=UPI0024CAFAB9|nr:hypothetical protein [Microcella sp.]UYN83921.1 MAG: hypothetical protein KIT89_01410 [Microcella sp.]